MATPTSFSAASTELDPDNEITNQETVVTPTLDTEQEKKDEELQIELSDASSETAHLVKDEFDHMLPGKEKQIWERKVKTQSSFHKEPR